MKYSRYIDGLIAEAFYVKDTGDTSVWLRFEENAMKDPVKKELFLKASDREFISRLKKDRRALQTARSYLESLAIELLYEEENCPREDEDEAEGTGESGNGKTQMKNEKAGGTDDEDGIIWPYRDIRDTIDESAEKPVLDSMESAADEFLHSSQTDNDSNSFFGRTQDGYQKEREIRFLSQMPVSLKRLARMIGRTGGHGTEKGGNFVHASKSDISGISIGDDLGSMLPVETAMLACKETQDVFFRNYAEKRLQIFSSVSSCRKPQDHSDGPVIICLDTSGSMQGKPVIIAMALTIAITIYSLRRRRKVFVIKYSDIYDYRSFVSIRQCRADLGHFLRYGRAGGNNENLMFTDLFSKLLPLEPEFDTADILCISDFGWDILDGKVLEMISAAKAGGMKFYGLCIPSFDISGNAAYKLMSVCDSKWLWTDGRCVQMKER